MKPAILTLLLLLVSAAPATRPTTAPAAERLIVQVRHVDYVLKPGEPPIAAGNGEARLPNDLAEQSSLQVTADVGQPFEAVALITGKTYRLAGRLKKVTGDAERYAVEIDYCESSGDVAKSTSQIKSRIIASVEKPMPLGGMTSDRAGSVVILTLKRA